jgi:competence protein ComEA
MTARAWRAPHVLGVLLLCWVFGVLPAAHAAVEVNQASLAELEAVAGIGTALAERIVEARRGGGFRDWTDLIARVRGLGPSSAARLSSGGLVVEGRHFEPTRPPRAASAAR